MNNETFAKIIEKVTQITGDTSSTLTPETSFVSLGIDSLDSLQMLGDLEDEFGVKISNEDILKIRTLGEAAIALENAKQ